MSGEPARWTEEQLAEHMKKFSGAKPDPNALMAGERVYKRPQPKRGQMNKTETLYSNVLAAKVTVGQIVRYRFEAMTLVLAPGCRFTPDFMVTSAEPYEGETIELHEVKSGRVRKSGKVGPFMEDDARCKLLTAAQLFPEFEFYLAWYWKGNWEVERIRGTE
jgi:hypothetical protein